MKKKITEDTCDSSNRAFSLFKSRFSNNLELNDVPILLNKKLGT